MRILWLSREPWAFGGYSNQTALLTQKLKEAGTDIAIAAYSGLVCGILEWRGIPVYPMPMNHGDINSIVGLHYQHWHADVLFSLHDGQAIIDGPSLKRKFPKLRWSLWFPVDSEPFPSVYANNVSSSFLPMVMSRFGEKVAREAGFELRYTPHGIDLSIFQPIERADARKKLGWPQQAFIVSMVAANCGYRKAFPQNIEGFARFHDKHPDSMLYLQTQKTAADGLDLEAVCVEFGLEPGENVFFCDLYSDLLGIPDSEMALIYNASNALLSVTMGEGFGLPIVEAQACGTPVIVGDWSAMSELCFSGWKVTKDESDRWQLPIDSTWRLPHVDAIADRIEQAYQSSNDLEESRRLRETARRSVLEYDLNAVVERYWVPILAQIQDQLD